MTLNINVLNSFNNSFGTSGSLSASQIASYYQYLADNNIAYGEVAKQVATEDGFFGEVANDYFDYVNQKNQPELSQQQIDSMQDTIRDALARADLQRRIDNVESGGNGEISYKDINTYHQDAFTNNGSSYDAWTGAAFDEFFGYGSYMPDYDISDDDLTRGMDALLNGEERGGINGSEFLLDMANSGAWSNAYSNLGNFIDAAEWGSGFDAAPYFALPFIIMFPQLSFGAAAFAFGFAAGSSLADQIFDYLYYPFITPLVLDLDQDGEIELTPLADTNTSFFDLDGDGYAEQTGWVQADDGLLAIDRNGDGVIHDLAAKVANDNIFQNEKRLVA